MSESSKYNTKGGKNYKKNKTGRVREIKERAKIDVDNGEGYYATITKFCGCDNLIVQARENNESYRVQIPGRMHNRGGGKNRLKVGDEVLVLGPLDKNVIGVIERAVRSTDVDYGNATNINKSIFDDKSDEEIDDGYDELVKFSRRNKSQSHKGGDKIYSTEEEIIAGLSNMVIQNVIPEHESESEESVVDIKNI